MNRVTQFFDNLGGDEGSQGQGAKNNPIPPAPSPVHATPDAEGSHEVEKPHKVSQEHTHGSCGGGLHPDAGSAMVCSLAGIQEAIEKGAPAGWVLAQLQFHASRLNVVLHMAPVGLGLVPLTKLGKNPPTREESAALSGALPFGLPPGMLGPEHEEGEEWKKGGE